MEIDALRAFVKVAELASFTRAGANLSLSKARVSALVAELEAELGTRLFTRSTRAVRLTPSGEQLVVRARPLLAEADDLASLFRPSRAVRGKVRVDMSQAFARSLYIPRVPEFLATHPGIELELSTTDRRVDVVREGFDCVLRIGQLADSRLTVRRLGSLPMVNCASAAYVARHGLPRTLDDLDRHWLIDYVLAFGSAAPAVFEYVEGGKPRERVMRSRFTVNSTDSYETACMAGLGIIQVPRYGMAPKLAAGALVEVLPEYVAAPMPVSIVHAHARSVPKHVRVVMNWLAELIAPSLTPA